MGRRHRVGDLRPGAGGYRVAVNNVTLISGAGASGLYHGGGIKLGASDDGGATLRYLNGEIADVRFYSRALSSADLDALIAGPGSSPINVVPPVLVRSVGGLSVRRGGWGNCKSGRYPGGGQQWFKDGVRFTPPNDNGFYHDSPAPGDYRVDVYATSAAGTGVVSTNTVTVV